ncbi:MAG: sensor histidine kinase, partial [Paracoccaceae bacterium]
MRKRHWLYLLSGLGIAGVAAAFQARMGSAGFFLVVVASFAVFAVILEFALRDDSRVRRSGGDRAPDKPPQELSRTVLNQIPAPVIVVGRNGLVAYANPASFRAFPWLERNSHFASLFRAPAFVGAVGEVLQSGGLREVAFSAHHGTERYYEAQVSALPDSDGFLPEARALILVMDRSAERLTEMKRRDFVANASHELRTPLASIAGFAETLRGPARNDPEASAEFVGIIADQAARMQRLVDDLLALSRIELTENETPAGEVDLDALAGEAVRALEPEAAKRGISLRHEPAPGGVPVSGDREQLYQVVLNLIDNAIKYSRRNDTVTVGPADAAPPRSGRVGVCVADTGPGIAPEHVPRLTERFYRVSAQESRDRGGTGLGLAIVKHILNRHHGELEIRSEPGKGSRFTVWLP